MANGCVGKGRLCAKAESTGSDLHELNCTFGTRYSSQESFGLTSSQHCHMEECPEENTGLFLLLIGHQLRIIGLSTT